MRSQHRPIIRPSVGWSCLLVLMLAGGGVGCTSGDSNALPTSTVNAPPPADPDTEPDSSVIMLHGVAFDPQTSAQFAGTPLSGLTPSTVMVTIITGSTELTLPFAIEQVTVEVDGHDMPCWYFAPEGLLAKDVSGAIRVVGGKASSADDGFTLITQMPYVLLPAAPIGAGTTFVPFPSRPSDQTVISVNQTAPTGATGCLLLRHSGPGVEGVVVFWQNRDRWILPGAAMPFQASYLMSLDRTIRQGGYRFSHPAG